MDSGETQNSPKTKLISSVNSIAKHNAYGILSHSDDPIPDDVTIYIDPPLAQQDTDIHEHRKQPKIAWRQHIKQMLHLLSKSKNLFLDNNITQAEDERTILAKGDQTNTQRRAIDSAHVKNNKPEIGLAQCGCNTAYSLGTTTSQTLKKNSNNKHVRFAKNNEVHLFDNTETPIMITYNSGANGHYISKKDRRKAGLPIIKKSTKQVGVANEGVSQAIFVTQIPFKALSAQATQADTFQDFPSSLMSVGKTADDGTISIFTKDGVTIHKEMDVLITCTGEPILIGVRDEQGRYRIPLIQRQGQWQPRRPSKQARKCLRQASSVYDLPSMEQVIKWMHAVCGYPVKSTWLKAIKAGNYIGWPMLTERNVNKYYPETSETPKGHMNQTRKNVCSTKAKQTPLETCDTSQLHSKKVRDIYTTMYDVCKTMFSDQTGQFPTRLQSSNKYIMVLVKIVINAILVEPMKNCKDAEMIRAYNALLLQLKRTGIIPKKHVLDNEVLENMKNHSRHTCKINMELVPPGCHQQNAAEVAIRKFKSHFLSILAGVADDFPQNLWDRLLPQTEITLNLIRQSNAMPTVSAYAHLSGPFDYNKMLLAPMGCKAQIHEKTDK